MYYYDKDELDEFKEADLAQALDDYTDKDGPLYDPVFDKKIRSLRPDLFTGK